ncbi:cell division protein FtsQ/DivIB [Lacticaseibacillus songhuajiangensis]|jgi:cell division protein FtsQ|uniref:cell division protein FtsQ/DivIB n=1 Tax=Lacticaseibacillus songhuajiangensis TaxID=1296539 RepID=UPI000F79B2CB|nr:cell division protein FtsQ/DivIB [Lacticaseibacillus songhuajiangensis]MCI1283121.1 cell division protein FtsQ/DivIB [Lacticaseibacillus songhuajiangensis]
MAKQDDNSNLFTNNFSSYKKQLDERPQEAHLGPAEIQKNLPKVQKIREHRTWRSLAILVPPLLIIGLASAYMASPLSKVRNVSVYGTNLVTNQEVINASKLGSKSYVPQLLTNRQETEQRIKKAVPAIKTVRLRVRGARDVSLRVSEYSATAYLHNAAGYHVILSTGKVLQDASKSPKQGLPVFTGFTAGKDLRNMSKIVAAFPTAIRRDVSEVTLSRGNGNPYQITIAMNDGNKIVADSRTILKKIKYYPSMVAQLKTTGTVDLEVGAFFVPKSEK